MTLQHVKPSSERATPAIQFERNQLARRLHDELGSGLTLLQMQLAWIQENGDVSVAKRASLACAEVKRLLQASSRLAHDTRAGNGSMPLSDLIEDYLSGIRQNVDLSIRFDYGANSTSLPHPIRVAVFYTVVEAITNVIRHADATDVLVSLVVSEAFASLEITDNGNGYCPAPNHDRLGIVGLKEQAHDVGGWLEISGTPGLGTSLLLHVPLIGRAANAKSVDKQEEQMV